MRQFRALTQPVVLHGLNEVVGGAPLSHVIREATVAGMLLAAGLDPYQAVLTAERLEPYGLGLPLREAYIEPLIHPEVARAVGMLGWPGTTLY